MGPGILCAGREGAGWAPVTPPPGHRSSAPSPRSASAAASGAYLIIASQVSGLKSMSYGCAIPDLPDMYTSLAYYRDWILDTMAS